MQEKQLKAMLNITHVCNFNCKYCSQSHINQFSPIIPEKLSKALKQHGENWKIIITGGEPFLYPDFVKICQELTKEFLIKINTNLSLSSEVKKFAESINPNMVDRICAALHIEERERQNGVEIFIKNVLLLKKQGFKVDVLYVLYPPLLKRFKKDAQYFKSRGLDLIPKPFCGKYMGKFYPKAFPNNTRDFFVKNNSNQAFYPFYFRGIKCGAGKSLVNILPDGTVSRCPSDMTVLGNISEGFKLNDNLNPCGVDRCGCFGYDLIERQPFTKYETNFGLLRGIMSQAGDRKHKRYLIRLCYSFIYGIFEQIWFTLLKGKPSRIKEDL